MACQRCFAFATVKYYFSENTGQWEPDTDTNTNAWADTNTNARADTNTNTGTDANADANTGTDANGANST
jgi:hypothetical protein